MSIVNVVTKSAVNPASVTYTHNYGAVEDTPPTSRFYGDGSLKGFQTVPNIARGVLEYTAKAPNGNTIQIVTSINFANKHQHHLCEPVGLPNPKRTTITTADGLEVPNLALGAPALELSIILKSADVQKVLKDIRNAIEGLFGDGIGGPLFTKFKQAANTIATVLKEINRIIRIYVVNALLIVQVEKYISLLIQFITSLPAIFATALAECLTALKNALASALTFVLPDVGTGGLLGEIQKLQSNLALAENATKQVIAGAEQIVTDIQNIPTGINAAVDILSTSLSDIKNAVPKPIVNVSIF